ncbi:hypothetical protein [Planctopirus hydrillae]|uniref:Uncharacterized protein n=1 Tax=Planctopirus hydrillae TaxID=1841610 RepID=A0A1C3EQH9_9PLAN|nr:hypothetical protein [Planctopirus hydrillae]ODA35432.1 hypothetical protein A6X21_16580 [Planctopirus hydrillae]
MHPPVRWRILRGGPLHRGQQFPPIGGEMPDIHRVRVTKNVSVVSPEGVIHMKAIASKPRDLAVIHGIRVMQPEFD